MPRLVLAGGLDDVRSAFAAELVDTWNDIPERCADFHRPVELIPPERLEYRDEALYNGNWVVESNQFTRRQARAVRCATRVVALIFDDTQLDDSGGTRDKNLMNSRWRITGQASRRHVPLSILGLAGNEYADIAGFLGSQRLERHRYIQSLSKAACDAWYLKNHPL